MRRPNFILVFLSLAIAATIVFWPSRLPQPQNTALPTQPPPAPQLSDLGKPADLFHTSQRTTTNTPEIDAANLQKADTLNSPDQSVQQDLQIMAEFVDLLGKAGLKLRRRQCRHHRRAQSVKQSVQKNDRCWRHAKRVDQRVNDQQV